MTSPTANQTSARLEATFGLGRDWTSQAGQSATVWETPAYHLLWFDDAASDVELRRLWEARKGRQAYPVVLLAPSDDANKVRVAGPQDARPVRELPVSRVLDLLETSRSLAAREAASFLAREFSRLEEAVVPGLRVKDLLTPHFMRERLRWPVNEQRLSGAVEGIASTGSIGWRTSTKQPLRQSAPSWTLPRRLFWTRLSRLFGLPWKTPTVRSKESPRPRGAERRGRDNERRQEPHTSGPVRQGV